MINLRNKLKRKWITLFTVAVVIAVTVLAFPLNIAPDEGYLGDGSVITITKGENRIVIGNTVGADTADYTCDGTDDDVQFQAAVDALPASAGQLWVESGTYNFAALSTVTRAIDNVSIVGVGGGVYFNTDDSTAAFTAGGNNWLFANLQVDNGGIAMGATTDWMWLNVEVAGTYYSVRTDNINIEDHSSLHESGGADAIKLDDLATPDDNTDLNASLTEHGLLPKLGGGTTNYLRADGTWAAPAGGGDVTGPASSTDNAITRFDGATGKIIQDYTSNAPTISDTGDMNVDGNIDVDNATLTGYIDISEISEPATPAGNYLRLFSVDENGFSILAFKDSSGMVRKFVKDNVFIVYNNSGSTIAAGRIVYASGSTGSVPTVALAKADSSSTMPAVGVTVESIANTAYGRVMQVGLLEDVNTSSYSVSDILYVSAATAGILTATPPSYPNLRQEIGTVLVDDASVGAIQIVARSAFDDALISLVPNLENPPTEDEATKAPTSEWAFDHNANLLGNHGVPADPNADRLLMWDDVPGNLDWLDYSGWDVTPYTAGDALTLTGHDIDFDGGTAPGGELGGTWASPTVDSSIHDDEYIELGDTFGGDISGTYGAIDITESVLGVGGTDTVFPTDPNADRYLMWDDAPTGELIWATANGGDVTGPGSSVDNAIVRFDGVTGKIIQDYTSNAPTISDTGDITVDGDLTADNIITAGNVDGRDVSVDGTKLDTIENSADVTDATNVDAAGAVMEADYNADTFMYASIDDTPTATSPADVLAALSGHAGATFDWNEQTLTDYGIESGSTLDPSPTTGQWFLHTPTGRNILYQYNGSSWVSIQSFGSMTVYVDATDGTDQLTDHGQGVDGDAFATVQFAVDCIPGSYGGPVAININNESYDESVTIRGKSPTGDYSITLQGTLNQQASATADSKVQGTGATQGSLTDTGAFGAYDNMLLEITNDDEYRIIDSDTADVATIVGCFSDAVDLAYIVWDWGTDINSLVVTGGQKNVVAYDMEFDTSYGISVNDAAEFTGYRLKLVITGNAIITNTLGIMTLYRSYISSSAVGVVSYGYSTANLYASKVYTTGANDCCIRGQASFSYITWGTILDAASTSGTEGLEANSNSVGNCYSPAANGYTRIRNQATGVYAYRGGMVQSTANVQYSGNTVDESAVSASYGYID